jgi:hypothetical protein
MRKLMISAAAMTAFAALLASAPAKADANFGGPIQKGDQCWTNSTSSKDFGFWGACPKPASVAVTRPVRHHRHH